MKGLYCLSVANGSLDEEASRELDNVSQEMLRKNQKRRSIRGKSFEGIITTEFKTASIAGFSGQIFNATVEGERKIRVSFVVRSLSEVIEELADEDSIGGPNFN